MQKVVKFLEEYVQWIAISLGVLWIAWTGYSYWVTPPDTADVNGKQVAPGDVDEEVANSQYVINLAAAHDNQGPFPPDVQKALASTDPQKYVEAFTAQLNGAAGPQVAKGPVNAPFPGGTPPQLTTGPGNGPTTQPGLIPEPPKDCFVLETAKDQSAAQTGMSVVWRPDKDVQPPAPGTPEAQVWKSIPNPNPAANNANNPNPAGNINPNPNANANVLPANLTEPLEEVTWVTVSGVLDMKKLAASFQKANIPDAMAITAFLRVELVRQEMQPDGSWGAEKLIDPLTNVYLPPWPPAAGAEADYLSWAMNNTPTIAWPPFYEVSRGQPWKTVHMPDQADLAAPQPVEFNPANVKPGEVWKLPDDQKKLWFKWYQDQQKQKAAQQPRPTPRTTPGSGGGATGGNGHAMLLSPSYRAKIILAGDHGDAPASGFNRGGFIPQPMAAPGGQQLPQSTISGAFIPAQQTQDPEIWAHDETTKPGVVYRYKLRVYLKNPLFGTVNIAKNQNNAQILAIKVETDWSKPILSPNKHEFFVINGGTTFGGVQKVGIDYFEWQNGAWKQETKTLQPGDRIGKTPWTIVDLRPVGNTENDSRVLIINDNGQLATRFYKTDRADPEYLRIKALVAPPAVPGTPGAPGTPTAQAIPQQGA